MNAYEIKQIKAIERWKREEPGVASRIFDSIAAPLTWLASRIVPVDVIQAAIEGADLVAQFATDAKDIMRDGNVSTIPELRTKSLHLSDRLADDVHNWAMATAWISGTTLGVTGIGGVVFDVGALIALSLRSIHKIGLCYGYERLNEQFVLGILSVAGAADRTEKKNATDLMRDIEAMILEEAAEGAVKDAVLDRAAERGAFFAMRGVCKQLGRNIIRRKSLQLVPLVGAALGGATNISFVADLGWAARRSFQEKWLIDNGRILPKAAVAHKG